MTFFVPVQTAWKDSYDSPTRCTKSKNSLWKLVKKRLYAMQKCRKVIHFSHYFKLLLYTMWFTRQFVTLLNMYESPDCFPTQNSFSNYTITLKEMGTILLQLLRKDWEQTTQVHFNLYRNYLLFYILTVSGLLPSNTTKVWPSHIPVFTPKSITNKRPYYPTADT